MAFDGTVIRNVVYELKNEILGARISKIAQPENEELILTFKGTSGTKRLLISANPSLPLIYFTSENKVSPMTAPNFCMLLRKHISNGKISKVSQIGFERVICIEVEHLDELHDIAYKKLYIEIMGKHSNIIFCDENDVIIDSIKHVGANLSSVREVLPGRDYFIPYQEGKLNPINTNFEEFLNVALTKGMPPFKAIYTSYTGISPFTANEIIEYSKIVNDRSASSLTDEEKKKVFDSFTFYINNAKFIDYKKEGRYNFLVMHIYNNDNQYNNLILGYEFKEKEYYYLKFEEKLILNNINKKIAKNFEEMKKQDLYTYLLSNNEKRGMTINIDKDHNITYRLVKINDDFFKSKSISTLDISLLKSQIVSEPCEINHFNGEVEDFDYKD